MKRINKYLFSLLFLFVFITCGTRADKENLSDQKMSDLRNLYAGVSNPASVYCNELGYETQMISDSKGNQYESCIFPDGSECRSWDFLKGKCGQKFSLCERKGGKIRTEIKDMGTWRMEYAVCVFPDGSETLEWELFRSR